MTELECTLRSNRIEQMISGLREQQATHICDMDFFHYCQKRIDQIATELDILYRESETGVEH